MDNDHTWRRTRVEPFDIIKPLVTLARAPGLEWVVLCGEGELVSRVHTLVERVVQVYHRLYVVEEEEKVRKVEHEVEKEDQGGETAHTWMAMEMT